MFNRVLIANRGEIACRIMRTCQRLGIETVAVYSQADGNSRHVAMADVAICIGEAPARDSYLRADRIIEAALHSGAQAIHPGYGFLSEKLELIDACAANALVFIGPNRHAIAAMGSKIESKRMARAAGVVCVPGYDGDDQSPERLLSEARNIGFPVLIKASAGGGGKGMRRVNAEAEFTALLNLAQREAMASFGDDRVLLEKYIVNPRHLEVQLMGDQHGSLVHLFERECSVQRRFQKVVEEAPANHLSADVAQRLYDAALRMGNAMAYDNAGTVEFVLDADQGETPYFLEVNTRLQVEHGVTEMTTGVDLIEWQLRSASGEALPLAQSAITRNGWSIECRINAEDTEHGDHASLGQVLGYAEPARAPGVRIDSGLHAGSEVTPYYDSMVAKVLGYGATREQAIDRAEQGIAGLRIEGIRTNASLLLQIIRHPQFSEVLTTRFLEQHFAQGPVPHAALRQAHTLAVAAAWAAHQPVTAPVWSSLRGLRLTQHAGRGARTSVHLAHVPDGAEGAAVTLEQNGAEFRMVGVSDGLHATVQPLEEKNVWSVQITDAVGAQRTVLVRHTHGERWTTWSQGQTMVWNVGHELVHRQSAQSGTDAGNTLSAGLPGRISEVLVQPGALVQAGDPVLTLEAMKLYHILSAPFTGRVAVLNVGVGDIVAQGQCLVEFEAALEAAQATE